MEVVPDEVELLASLVPLEGAVLLELGCGKAEFSRKLVERTAVASVDALEVDRIQLESNLAASPTPRLTFRYGGAQQIPFDDGRFDGVLLMKSLHHIPLDLLPQAFREIRRVLKPEGWVYVSEPVYAGSLNEITRLFHDEGRVRAAAYNALQQAACDGVLREVEERWFEMPAHYASYDEFVKKHVHTTHSEFDYPERTAAEVRRRLEAFMGPKGADFMRPMRFNLLRRP